LKNNRLIKLGILAPGFPDGGGVTTVTSFLYEVAKESELFDPHVFALSTSWRDDLSVNLINPRSWLKGAKYTENISSGITFKKIGAFLSEFEFQRYKRRRVLDSLLQDMDIIQVISGSAAPANTAIGLAKPLSIQVATFSNVERRSRLAQEKNVLGLWRRLMTYITYELDKRALRHADAIEVENYWMLKFVKGLNGKKENVDVRFIPPGVDPIVFCPLKDRAFNNFPYILCVGRLDDPRKNIMMLLRAFRRINKARPDVCLITAGLKKPREDFFRMASDMGVLNRIKHIDSPDQDTLIKLYQNAAVFCLPSNEEGLGLVILEAMSCGIPIVATRCGGPEVLVRDGANGYLVPLNDEEKMAEQVIQILNNREMNIIMGKMSRKIVLESFTKRMTGKQFIEIWKSLSTSARTKVL